MHMAIREMCLLESQTISGDGMAELQQVYDEVP